ncbi:hypothetical protein IT417_02875 [bacterium]|nr:hypothetical protein [bacterium]
MAPRPITAPLELVSQLEQFKEHTRNGEDLTAEGLTTTIKAFSKAIKVGFEGASEFLSEEAELSRDEFFAEYVHWSDNVLALALKQKGIDRVLVSTPTGIQGAGKGTYGDTLQVLAQELVEEMASGQPKKYKQLVTQPDAITEKCVARARSQEVKTGTGGIFNHKNTRSEITTDEEREYFDLFNDMKNAMGAAKGVFVENNIVAIALNLYMALKVMQNEEGISSFNIDLYPRSQRQIELLEQTTGTLQDNGIVLEHSTIDFKLLNEEQVQQLLRYKNSALAILPKVQEGFTTVIKRVEEVFRSHSDDYTFDELRKDLTGIIMSASEGETDAMRAAELMLNECLSAANRTEKRGKESKRPDDRPIPLLKRLKDYFAKSFAIPFLFENPMMFATDYKPEEVARKVFCKYFSIEHSAPELQNGGKYYDLYRRYQYLAACKVYGEFKGDLELRQIKREKPDSTELIYWGEAGNVIFYSFIQKPGGNSVMYTIGHKGTTFTEDIPGLANTLKLEIPQTQTIAEFIENNPPLWYQLEGIFI